MELTDYRDIIYRSLERIRSTIADNINSKGLRASGKTEKSMRIEMYDEGGRLVGRQYFQSLEEGRPAGKVPYNFPAIIKQWIRDKGIAVQLVPYKRRASERWQPKYSVEERSLNMAAGAIAHSIATRGTLLYRQGGRRDIYTPIIEEETKRLEGEIGILVADTIRKAIN